MKHSQTLPLLIVAAVICVTPGLEVAAGRLSQRVLGVTQERPREGDKPKPNLTPGDKLPVSKTAVCARGYAAGILDVPTSYKNRVFAAYRLAPSSAYVIDRLISIDLGGANNLKNLWPQPTNGYWNSLRKDQLERELRRRVCNGSLSLETAQQEIARDWVTAYPKYLDAQGKPQRR